jgi:hypothetical protein
MHDCLDPPPPGLEKSYPFFLTLDGSFELEPIFPSSAHHISEAETCAKSTQPWCTKCDHSACFGKDPGYFREHAPENEKIHKERKNLFSTKLIRKLNSLSIAGRSKSILIKKSKFLAEFSSAPVPES